MRTLSRKSTSNLIRQFHYFAPRLISKKDRNKSYTMWLCLWHLPTSLNLIFDKHYHLSSVDDTRISDSVIDRKFVIRRVLSEEIWFYA